MDGRPAERRTVGERVGDRVRTGERGQEGRMDVQDPSWERGERDRPDDPHVSGQDHQVGGDRGQHDGESGVLLGTSGVVLARGGGHECGLDPLLGRPVESRTRAVREDEDDRPTELTALGRRREGTEVRASSGHADRDPTEPARHGNGPST